MTQEMLSVFKKAESLYMKVGVLEDYSIGKDVFILVMFSFQ